MTKIISSILIIVGIASVHSCREQDEDQLADIQIENKQSSNAETNKDGDTGLNAPESELTEHDGITEDPPPKDTGQWKVVKSSKKSPQQSATR